MRALFFLLLLSLFLLSACDDAPQSGPTDLSDEQDIEELPPSDQSVQNDVERPDEGDTEAPDQDDQDEQDDGSVSDQGDQAQDDTSELNEVPCVEGAQHCADSETLEVCVQGTPRQVSCAEQCAGASAARCGINPSSAIEECLCLSEETCEGWSCEPGFYNANDGCDCDCGCYDPDCLDPAATLYCPEGEICSLEGRCEPACVEGSYACVDANTESFCQNGAWENQSCEDYCGDQGMVSQGCVEQLDYEGCLCSPQQCESWTCAPEFYAAGDDCDCGCGCWDPDCDDTSLTIFGCAEGEICIEEGLCFDEGCLAGTQTCVDDETLGICDGSTGVVFEERCEDFCANEGWENSEGCETIDGEGGCVCTSESACLGWTCDASEYADGAVCNCECGCWDPDCESVDLSTCESGEICIAPGQCTRCPNQPRSYNCPELEDEVFLSDQWCLAPNDGGAYDHLGTCYRSIFSGSGSPAGQQCCYDENGFDNCTGSPDLVGPAIGKKGDGTCAYDIEMACQHCSLDVIPFCYANCMIAACEGVPGMGCTAYTSPSACEAGFGCDWSYRVCGGDLPDGGGWSTARCGCGLAGDLFGCEDTPGCSAAAEDYRCKDAFTLKSCTESTWASEGWQLQDCENYCLDHGFESAVGCAYEPSVGHDTCLCAGGGRSGGAGDGIGAPEEDRTYTSELKRRLESMGLGDEALEAIVEEYSLFIGEVRTLDKKARAGRLEHQQLRRHYDFLERQLEIRLEELAPADVATLKARLLDP